MVSPRHEEVKFLAIGKLPRIKKATFLAGWIEFSTSKLNTKGRMIRPYGCVKVGPGFRGTDESSSSDTCVVEISIANVQTGYIPRSNSSELYI